MKISDSEPNYNEKISRNCQQLALQLGQTNHSTMKKIQLSSQRLY